MRGIIDPQTRTVTGINHRMGEGLSTVDRTILSTTSVVYSACQTKQDPRRTSLCIDSLAEREIHLEKNLVSEPHGNRGKLSANARDVRNLLPT